MRLIGLAVILTVSLILAPLATAGAQAGKIYRVGFLLSGGPAPNPAGPNPGLLEFDAFVHRMRELGYILGQNLTIEARGAEGKYDRLPGLVTELIALKVDLIFAPATPAAQAAKNATNTTPIVIAVAPSPVEDGLVASLARSGGNVTGLTSTSLELSGKRLQLLKEIVPRATRLAVLGNPDSSVSRAQMSTTQSELLLVVKRARGSTLGSPEPSRRSRWRMCGTMSPASGRTEGLPSDFFERECSATG